MYFTREIFSKTYVKKVSELYEEGIWSTKGKLYPR
jgi:hypothetical protein